MIIFLTATNKFIIRVIFTSTGTNTLCHVGHYLFSHELLISAFRFADRHYNHSVTSYHEKTAIRTLAQEFQAPTVANRDLLAAGSLCSKTAIDYVQSHS